METQAGQQGSAKVTVWVTAQFKPLLEKGRDRFSRGKPLAEVNKRKERHPKQSKQGKTGITWRRKEKTIFTILREGKDIVSPSNNYRSNDQNSS